MSPPTERTLKQLFGLSGNECAHPDCATPLLAFDANTDQWVVYAKVAHIHAQQPKGERYDAAIAADPAVLHGFDNLILLCGPHHDQIDQTGAGEYYTADMIRGWKAARVLAGVAEQDREWVFGGTTISFVHEGQHVGLRFWRTTTGEARFYTDSQLEQVDAARDASLWIAQIGSILSIIDQADAVPADLANRSFNDGYMRMLKERVEQLRQTWVGTVPEGGFENGLHRFYDRLHNCSDVTMAELAEVGTDRRTMTQSILVGDVTPERIAEAIQAYINDTN